MKKVISLAIVFSMLFAISASAVTTIQYTYTDKDGIVYHVGTFDAGDTDAGVIVNGKKHSLKNGIYKGTGANAFEEAAGKQGKFAIGLYTGADYSDATYSVVPYSTDAEGKDKIGQAITVTRNADRRFITEKVIENPVVADVRNEYNNDQNVSNSAVNVLTLKADSEGIATTSQNYTALLKLDLRALKNDTVDNGSYKLTLNGLTGTWGSCIYMPEVVICVGGVKEELAPQNWDEGENVIKYYKSNGEARSYYNTLVTGEGAVLLDKVSTPASTSGYKEYTFNITGFIQQEIAKGNDYATLAVWLDTTALEAAYNAQPADAKARIVNTLKIKTREHADRAYSIIYEGKDDSAYEAGLKSLKVAGEEVLKYIDAENTYTKYLPYGTTEVPVVSAEGIYASSIAEVTQAASLSDVATVKVKAAVGDKEETYKVKFVVSPLESEAAALNVKTEGLVLATAQGVNGTAAGTVNAAGTGALQAFEARNTTAYNSYASFVKLDLTDFATADLSGDFTLDIKRLLVNWDTAKVSEIDASLYDVSDIFNWETDKTNNSGQTMVETLKGMDAIDTVRIETALSAGKATDLETPFTFDLSEFVRKCVRENNLTPTIAFNITNPETFTDARRICMYLYLDSGSTSTSAVFNYSKYDAEALEALSEITISSIKAGNDEINLAMIGADNKYVKYLPFGTTEVPQISVVANETADVSITQAESLSDVAKIKVTSMDKSKTVEYEISFVVADNMSDAAFIDVRDGFFAETITGSINAAKADAPTTHLNITGTNKIQAFEAQSDSRYASCVSFVKLDLTKLTDVDLSKSITLDSYRAGINWDFAKMTQADMLIYDATDLINWETAKTDASGQTVEPLLGADRLIDSVRVNSDMSNGRQGDVLATPVTFDITEFVAKCLSEGITQPVIAFDVEYAYAYSGMLRINNEHYYGNAGNMMINYSKVKDMPELRDTSLHALTIDFAPVNTAYINPENNTYTKYLPYGSEIPYVEAEVDPWSQVWVTQAEDFSEPAVIDVRAYNGDEKTYYVNFVVSGKETAETTNSIGWNQGVVTNNGKNIVGVTEQTSGNTVYTYTDTVGYITGIRQDNGKPQYKYIMQNTPTLSAYNSPKAKTGYVPQVSMVQLDLNRLVNVNGLDLSKPIELHMDGAVNTYNKGVTDSKGNEITSLDLSVYDLTGADWSIVHTQSDKIIAEKDNVLLYDYTNPNPEVYAKANEEADVLRKYLRDIDARLNGKTEIARQTISYGNYGFTNNSGSSDNIYKAARTFEANGFLKIDISEFVRYCVATGNMTPTLGFYVNPADTNVECRQYVNFNCSGTGIMSYLYYFK